MHGLSFSQEMKAQRITMLGVASHSSRRILLRGRWVLLEDIHGDHFYNLFALIVVDGSIPRFLMADVNGETTGLSKGSSARSRDHAVGGATAAAPSPALVPPDFQLHPLALQGNLDLEEETEPCF